MADEKTIKPVFGAPESCKQYINHLAGRDLPAETIMGLDEHFHDCYNTEPSKSIKQAVCYIVDLLDHYAHPGEFVTGWLANYERNQKLLKEAGGQKMDTNTQKYEVTEKELEARQKLSKEMADKAAQGKAVWQIDKKDRPVMHLPVNPHSGNHYTGANAILLMQAQAELNTSDNRWVPAKVVSAMMNSKKDVYPKKGTKSISIVSGGEETKMFNYSQLGGKELTNVIDLTDAKNAYAEDMLAHNTFDKVDLEKSFWITAKNVYQNTDKKFKANEAKKTEYAEKSAAYEGDFNKRLDEIKAVDVSKKAPTSEPKRFIHYMAQAYQANPERNDYVMKAARQGLIDGMTKSHVKQYVTKFAPEAAKDPAKTDKYSNYVMGVMDKDQNLQAELKNAKTAAR